MTAVLAAQAEVIYCNFSTSFVFSGVCLTIFQYLQISNRGEWTSLFSLDLKTQPMDFISSGHQHWGGVCFWCSKRQLWIDTDLDSFLHRQFFKKTLGIFNDSRILPENGGRNNWDPEQSI